MIQQVQKKCHTLGAVLKEDTIEIIHNASSRESKHIHKHMDEQTMD